MDIMPGFTLTDIETSGARIRLRHGGNGPPLLLLHGNPLTHVSWHAVAPRLAEHFHVVAADLRGYGDSSAPPEEPDSINYSFRAMAQDQVEVMQALGYRPLLRRRPRPRRAHHAPHVPRPSGQGRSKPRSSTSCRRSTCGRRWTRTAPSAAGTGRSWRSRRTSPSACWAAFRPDWFMRKKLLKLTADLNHIPPAIWDEYVRCFNEKTIRGSCADYRAAATIDCELDTADLGRKLDNADPGAVGATAAAWASGFADPLGAVAAARGGRPRRSTAERALCERGGAGAGA